MFETAEVNSPHSRERPPPDHHPRGDRGRHPDRLRHPGGGHVPQESQDDDDGLGLGGRKVDDRLLGDLGIGEGGGGLVQLQQRGRRVILALV